MNAYTLVQLLNDVPCVLGPVGHPEVIVAVVPMSAVCMVQLILWNLLVFIIEMLLSVALRATVPMFRSGRFSCSHEQLIRSNLSPLIQSNRREGPPPSGHRPNCQCTITLYTPLKSCQGLRKTTTYFRGKTHYHRP